MDASSTLSVLIVPTGVGVNRVTVPDTARGIHCPHGRGGEPVVLPELQEFALLSPRAWG